MDKLRQTNVSTRIINSCRAEMAHHFEISFPQLSANYYTFVAFAVITICQGGLKPLTPVIGSGDRGCRLPQRTAMCVPCTVKCEREN